VQGELPAPLRAALDELGLELAGVIPADDRIGEHDALGKPLVSLNGDSPAIREIEAMAARFVDSL
jgi:CO dehydrogenase nickel-insertion accessory protein CooC1